MCSILPIRVLNYNRGKTRYVFQNIPYKRSYGCNGIDVATRKGIEYLRNPKLNKDLAFTLDERQSLRVHGLLPAAIRTQDEQAELFRIRLDRCRDNTSKYIYLYDLQERNEKLFYRLLSEDLPELLPIVYTPTVGEVCRKYGLTFHQPRGLFISIYDRGHISEVLKNWPETDVRAIVVTDGENVPNVDDMGAYGMSLAVGKAVLYTAAGGIKPHRCLPITLDVGTNNEKLLKDPFYIGLRHHRTIGPTYQEFMDEFVDSVTDRYGSNTVIHFEGFSSQNSTEFLRKYRKKCCFLNDELQSIGTLVLAGCLGSETILNKPIKDYTILFLNTEDSSFAIANTIVKYLQSEGITSEEAKYKIWMSDEHGLLTQSRSEEYLEGEKLSYAKDFEPIKNPAEIIEKIKPNVLIDASNTLNSFTPEILNRMAAINHKPLIFALNDPMGAVDCIAEHVYQHTQGKAIFTSTSNLSPRETDSKNYQPGYANNCLVYPGIVLGTIASGMKGISDDIFPIAARCLANNVAAEDLQVGRVLPSIDRARDCAVDIAAKVCEYAYDKGTATYYPEPKDKKTFVKAHMYDYRYIPYVKHRWEWLDRSEASIDLIKKEYYGRMFNKSPPTFSLEVDEDNNKPRRIEPVIEVPKKDLGEIKIVERLPPESLLNKKPDPTA